MFSMHLMQRVFYYKKLMAYFGRKRKLFRLSALFSFNFGNKPLDSKKALARRSFNLEEEKKRIGNLVFFSLPFYLSFFIWMRFQCHFYSKLRAFNWISFNAVASRIFRSVFFFSLEFKYRFWIVNKKCDTIFRSWTSQRKKHLQQQQQQQTRSSNPINFL